MNDKELRNLNKQLLKAAGDGDLAQIKVLLAAGADINFREEGRFVAKENTPLLRACREGHAEVAALLIDRGADMYARTKDDVSPLLIAADREHLGVIRVLLAKGADINYRYTSYIDTALLRAADKGNLSIVTFLAENGADLESKRYNPSGPDKTAKQVAHEKGYLVVEKFLKEFQPPVKVSEPAPETEPTAPAPEPEVPAADANLIVIEQQLGDRTLQDYFNFAAQERISFVRAPDGTVEQMERTKFADIKELPALQQATEERDRRAAAAKRTAIGMQL